MFSGPSHFKCLNFCHIFYIPFKNYSVLLKNAIKRLLAILILMPFILNFLFWSPKDLTLKKEMCLKMKTPHLSLTL